MNPKITIQWIEPIYGGRTRLIGWKATLSDGSTERVYGSKKSLIADLQARGIILEKEE